MSQKRRQHSAKYKFRIALEAARGEKTVSQIASEHNVHPNQVRQWKRRLLESGRRRSTLNLPFRGLAIGEILIY